MSRDVRLFLEDMSPTIDVEIAWDIVTRKVPEPLRQVESILAAEFATDG